MTIEPGAIACVGDGDRTLGRPRQVRRDHLAEAPEPGPHPVPVRRRTPQAVEADDLPREERVVDAGQIRRPSSSRSALHLARPLAPRWAVS